MSNFQDVNLTESDFKLLIDALEALPEKGTAGLLIGGIMGEMLAGDNQRLGDMAKELHRKKEREHNIRVEALKEDIAILKSKLIQLKRHLLSEGALKTANDILSK